MTRLTLDQLNALLTDAFVAALGDVFEHAPWVAAAVAPLRPFPTVAALHDAMVAAVRAGAGGPPHARPNPSPWGGGSAGRRARPSSA
jgi:2-oxo-4-hydroxy-4-carboxy-5-ureidoimidazoline decarboxylase